MTITDVKTPSDWSFGACTEPDMVCAQQVRKIKERLTFTLSKMPNIRHKMSGPQRSQSLRTARDESHCTRNAKRQPHT